MKKLSSLILLTTAVSTVYPAMSQERIPIEDDQPVRLYALGAVSKVGVYQLNLNDLANPTQLNTASVQYTSSNMGGGGTFLGEDKVVGAKYNYVLMAFEATAAGNDNGAWGESYYKGLDSVSQIFDMTWDEKSDIVYCWYKINSYNNALGIYDTTAHTVTRVGNAPNALIYGIAADKDGQLWGVGSMGLVYKIDKETGVATEITGGMGISSQFKTEFPISAAIDPNSGLMYVVGKTGSWDTFSTLAKIDLTTVKSETVGQLNGYYNCLSVVGSSIPAGAPAPAENLAASFDGESTVVSFTAPTKTVGDKTLSGELTYTVTVDGESAGTGTVEAGAKATARVNAETGERTIAVTLTNSEGTSKSVKITVWCGYDTPGNISELSATADNTQVSLSWNAPEGIHGGVLDPAKLRYRVARNGETVADAQAETTFTDNVDGLYRQFDYSVGVVYDGNDGESKATSVMAGNPYEAPYEINLGEVATLGEAGISVIDPNTGNVRESGTWELAKSDAEDYIVSYSEYAFCRDDYAWLPLTNLKTGATYTLRFKAASTGNGKYGTFNDADLRVLIADKPTGVLEDCTELKSLALTTSALPTEWENGDAIPYAWNEYEVEFTVESDGDRSIALLDYAPNPYNYYYLAVKDLSLGVVYPVPMPATELSAEPEADNFRNIKLTFTLPDKDTNGNALSAITKVEILRGDEVIATLNEDLQPGAEATYTDEETPLGETEYTVIVYAGSEASDPTSVTISVGHAADLAIEIVSTPDEEIILPDGKGELKVKVTNNGYRDVEAGAYDVILTCDDKDTETKSGEALPAGDSAEYVFDLVWEGEVPATVRYTVKISFAADENDADNETEAVNVTFKTDNNSVASISREVSVEISDGRIIVRGGNASVHALDGTTIATGVGETVTPVLAKGIYVVKTDRGSFKVAL